MTEKQESEFRKRLKAVLEIVGTLQVAGELAGVTPDQVARWRDGKARPPFWPIAILARSAGRSLDWLAFDEDRHQGQFQLQSVAPLRTIEDDEDVLLIPMLDVVASAGPGMQNGDPEVVARLPFPRALLRRLGVSASDAHFITGRGDSMLPTIADQQIILVDASRTKARDDGVYVVVIGDDVRLKRIQRGSDGSIVLLSDNRELYEPERLGPADAESLRIAGKAFWKLGGEL